MNLASALKSIVIRLLLWELLNNSVTEESITLYFQNKGWLKIDSTSKISYWKWKKGNRRVLLSIPFPWLYFIGSIHLFSLWSHFEGKKRIENHKRTVTILRICWVYLSTYRTFWRNSTETWDMVRYWLLFFLWFRAGSLALFIPSHFMTPRTASYLFFRKPLLATFLRRFLDEQVSGMKANK